MSETTEFSRTIRIDLIPETPKKPVRNKKRIVVAPASRSEKIAPDAPSVVSKDEEGRYKSLLESIYDAALITDPNGKVVDVNARAADFFRCKKEELTKATSVSDLISGAEKTLLHNLSRNLEKQRFVLIQAYCVRRDQSQFPSEIAVAKVRTGEGENLGFFIRDITVRRQAEEMLRTEHNAIQNAANGIAIANLDGVLEYVNPAFSQMLGCDEQDELVGVSIKELFDGDSMADDLTSNVLEGVGSWSGEVSAEMPSGGTLDLQILANCNRNSDGETVGFVLSFTDLSDRKKAEASQREAERNRVMLESLGTACHHLGQPATLLMGNLSLLQSKIDHSDPVVADLVKSSIEAMDRLGDTLHKLNAVNEYRTTLYMENTGTAARDTTNILEI